MAPATYELYTPVAGVSNSELLPDWTGNAAFTKPNVIDALNMGAHFISRFWHSNNVSLECPPSDWSNYLRRSLFESDTIHNAGREGIFVTNGCHSNCLLMDSAFGRSMMVCGHGGAVAYGGQSKEGSFGEDPLLLSLIKSVYYYGVTTLGPAWDLAVTTVTQGQKARERITMNILGDPMMDIWTTNPTPLHASHPLQWSPKAGQFDVHVWNDGAQPVPGATVCLAMRNPTDGAYNVYHIGTTDGNGHASFSIDPKETGNIIVTVTKHDFKPYKGTCRVCLFSDNPQATANNEQRNLARVAGTEVMHLVYSNQGSIMHTTSYDGGTTWLRPELIDQGSYPTMALNYSQTPGIGSTVRDEPWIVYNQGLNVKAAILRSVGPTIFQTLFTPSASVSAVSPPACAASPVPGMTEPSAWVTYAMTYSSGATQSYQVQARQFTRFNVFPTSVLNNQPSSECSHPSIAITPGDIVHVVWQQANNTTGSNIMYCYHQVMWTPPAPIPLYLLNPHNPFIETYGDMVKVACSAPSTPSEIYTTEKLVYSPNWLAPSNASNSPDAQSENPALATGAVVVWQEGSGPGEVYANIAGELHNISSTGANSAWPSIDVKFGDQIGSITVYAVWTEAVTPGTQYEIRSGKLVWNPSFGRHDDAYLAVQTGDSVSSPYCQSRTGPIHLDQYALDYGTDSLSYRLPYLDPQYDYSVQAVAYHRDGGRWFQRFQLGDTNLTVKFDNGKPETLLAQIPVRTYLRQGDAPLTIRKLQGQYGVITDFIVRQHEPNRTAHHVERGGELSSNVFALHAAFAPPRPNPFKDRVQLAFTLNRPGRISLKVYDASGRMVKMVAHGEYQAGDHSLCWDCTGVEEARVANGVYFAKLVAEDDVKVHKLLLMR